ncbi:MAG: AI-2E family transporter [Gammaproteobacteria bacterium]|nr:AI-2E family transporter [Gammaproteobacteria bacterium]
MNTARRQLMESRVFLTLLVIFTILFALLMRPFWGAIFWAAAITIIFFPLHRRLLKTLGDRRNTAALLSLLAGIVLVVIPVVAVIFAFVQEGIQLYERIQSKEIDPAAIIEGIGSSVPVIPEFLQRLGIDLVNIREFLSSAAISMSQWLAEEALSFGRNTVSFILSLTLMLYLTFFLLRDGEKIIGWTREALPLDSERKQLLLGKFVEVTRATIKGNVLVAAVQGSLGGFIFWILGIPAPILWAVVMGFLSLIPAVGASLVWVPVAIYLYSTGAWVAASVLVAFGVIIIGLADNVLRPILVGRDTKLPDYMVLFSTLGGLSLMGINGFVIGPLLAALFLTFWTNFIRNAGNSAK